MTTENNKIIAEFMECEKSTSVGSKVLIIGESDFSGQIGQYTGIAQENSTGVYLSKDGSTRWFDLDEIKNIDFKDVKNYHSDWNWLMEVVKKIEETEIENNILMLESIGNEAKFIYDDGCRFLNSNIGETKIEAVYNACIEFIKWYNEQNKV